MENKEHDHYDLRILLQIGMARHKNADGDIQHLTSTNEKR